MSLIASLFGKQASELLYEFRLRMSCLLVNNNSRLYVELALFEIYCGQIAVPPQIHSTSCI